MMTPEDKLTLKIWEAEREGGQRVWGYGVYTGDGNEPGSLHAAAGGYNNPDTCCSEAHIALIRAIGVRDCEHAWAPWGAGGDIPICLYCNIVDWRE